MKAPVSISPNNSVLRTIDFMSKKRLREVCVADGDKLLGMVTLRDLINTKSDKKTKISEVKKPISTVAENEDMKSVANKILQTGLETLPVVSKNKLIGLVDTTGVLENAPIRGKVKDAMVPGITIKHDETIAKAREIMTTKKVNRLPVVDGNRQLLGIITASDILRRIFACRTKRLEELEIEKKSDCLKISVREAMTPSVITALPEMELKDATTIMLEQNIRALPVVKGNTMVGILCRKDILKFTFS